MGVQTMLEALARYAGLDRDQQWEQEFEPEFYRFKEVLAIARQLKASEVEIPFGFCLRWDL